MSENETKKPAEEEVKKPQSAEKKPEAKEVKANPEIEALKKQVEELKAKYEEAEKNFETADKDREEWKNKYYGAYADMANTRKQVEREASDFKTYAIQDFAKEIIPTLDAFDYSLKTKPEEEAQKKYFEGFEMIHKKLMDSLKGQGIEIISPNEGDDYEPNTMQALTTVPGKEDNKIHETIVKGYKLHDHLLRAAGVISTIKEVPAKSDKKDDTKADKK